MANLFLSYIRGDEDTARRIATDLRALGDSVWLDLENLSPTSSSRPISGWHDQLQSALIESDAVLVLISPASAKSQLVGQEWISSLQRGNQRVIPVLVDRASHGDLPPPLRKIHGINLSSDYAQGINQIHSDVARLDSPNARVPSLAESIDIAAIVEDIKGQVLEQLAPVMRSEQCTSEEYDQRLVFVIISFHPDMEPTFEAIAAAGETYGLRVERVKDVIGDYRITEKMLAMIRAAAFIVTDLTHERPNVYFELGYARGLGKRVITILREGTERHFDIYDWNYISYIDSRPLERTLRERFGREIESN